MKTYEQEKREAYEVGCRALDALKRAQVSMNKARTWGFIDIFSNGLLSTLVKRSHMNDAQREVNHALQLLNDYQRELHDINLTFDTDGFIEFSDYIFDNVFVDIFVQSKIKDACARIDSTILRLEASLNRLMY